MGAEKLFEFWVCGLWVVEADRNERLLLLGVTVRGVEEGLGRLGEVWGCRAEV